MVRRRAATATGRREMREGGRQKRACVRRQWSRIVPILYRVFRISGLGYGISSIRARLRISGKGFFRIWDIQFKIQGDGFMIKV
jgi:hypothetical protein